MRGCYASAPQQLNSLGLLKRKGQGGVMSRFFARLALPTQQQHEQQLFEMQKNFMLHLKLIIVTKCVSIYSFV